jgi:uncharacterized protein (DUF302 family)
MEKTIEVKHIVLSLLSSFEDFTQNLELVAGKFNEYALSEIDKTPEEAEAKMKTMAGREGLMIFSKLDHGQLLKLYGIKTKSLVYGIGNPLVAGSMTKIRAAAGLYAPIRIIVYQEADAPLYVEYDLPSSVFGQFGEKIGAIGLALDKKLHDLITYADVGDMDFC